MNRLSSLVQPVRQKIGRYGRLILGRPDPSRAFNNFEKAIHQDTVSCRANILGWAEEAVADAERYEHRDLYKNADSVLVRQGYQLTHDVRDKFRDKYLYLENLRVLIHLPSPNVSPGGYSLFGNLINSLNYIGVRAEPLNWGEPIEDALRSFRPTVLLTSDSEAYLSQINWQDVEKYRSTNLLKIGLTASIQEYGNTPLLERLGWAERQGVDFFYSFRSRAYLETRKEYNPFFLHGYEILSVEFGANPLIYYSVPSIERDLDFSFLASANEEKWQRYFSFLKPIFSKHVGLIDGPGWSFSRDFEFKPERDRYIYARSKIGLNLHIDNQIDWACELNERTYMLAACGVPQLVDKPKLLLDRFSEESFFVAETPKEYQDLFVYMLENRDEAERRALNAQREVFSSHTTFHRAEALVLALQKQLII